MASMSLESKGTPWTSRLPPGVEAGVLIVLCGLGLSLFFGDAIQSRFTLYPGELGDWRFNGTLAEHWFSVLKGQAEWRSPAMYYPLKGMLGYSDALFLFTPFYVPFRLAGAEPSLAFVFCFMTILAFGFVTSYWFMSRVLRSPPLVAFGLSFAFIFSNMGAAHFPHAQLYACAFLPLLLACGVLFVRSVLAGQPRIVPGVGFSVGLAAILYTGFYIGYLTILFLAFFFAVFLVIGGRYLPQIVRALWQARLALIVFGAAFAVALIPFAMTYLPVAKDVGARDWGMVECMLPFPRDFINVDGNAAWHWLVQKLGRDTRPCGWELTFGLPLGTQVAFGLSLVWLFVRWTSIRHTEVPTTDLTGEDDFRFRVVLALGFAVVLCWVAMLRLDSGSLWRILYTWVPGVTAVRAVFRFQMVLHFFVLIVIGFALSRLTWPAPAKYATAMQLIVVLVLAIENYNPTAHYFAGAARAAKLSSIPSPPVGCKQFFIAPEGLKEQPSFVGVLDGLIVGQRVRLPSLNGYSSGPPKGFYHTEFVDPLYLTKVAHWARSHDLLPGLCVLNLGPAEWHEVKTIASGIEAAMLNNNLLGFEHPMSPFIFERSGFHGLEGGGAWTTGDATIEFFEPLKRVRKVTIAGHRGRPQQPVAIEVGGGKVMVDPSSTEFRVEIATLEPVSSIRIRTDSFIPVASGLGADTRQLGVFLEAVMLDGN
jgi:hypothetical protein